MDEIHSYIGHEKSRFGFDREAGEYIDFIVGDRSTKTGMKLWNKIENQATTIVVADYWKSYNEMIPT